MPFSLPRPPVSVYQLTVNTTRSRKNNKTGDPAGQFETVFPSSHYGHLIILTKIRLLDLKTLCKIQSKIILAFQYPIIRYIDNMYKGMLIVTLFTFANEPNPKVVRMRLASLANWRRTCNAFNRKSGLRIILSSRRQFR